MLYLAKIYHEVFLCYIYSMKSGFTLYFLKANIMCKESAPKSLLKADLDAPDLPDHCFDVAML